MGGAFLTHFCENQRTPCMTFLEFLSSPGLCLHRREKAGEEAHSRRFNKGQQAPPIVRRPVAQRGQRRKVTITPSGRRLVAAARLP